MSFFEKIKSAAASATKSAQEASANAIKATGLDKKVDDFMTTDTGQKTKEWMESGSAMASDYGKKGLDLAREALNSESARAMRTSVADLSDRFGQWIKPDEATEDKQPSQPHEPKDQNKPSDPIEAQSQDARSADDSKKDNDYDYTLSKPR